MAVEENANVKTENKVVTDILFRELQYDFISRYMGPPASLPYPCLCVYGHTSTGKTLVVSRILQERQLPHVWINCHECFSTSLIFSSVKQKLSNDPKKITNICEFINFLRASFKDNEETFYLIFDSAEVLRKEDPFILACLSRLQQFTKTNIATIFITELPWTQFRSQIDTFNPICVHFPSYTKEEMCQILHRGCPEDYDASFYMGYVNVIMKTFYTVTRNLSELQHLSRVNFEKYCEPLEEDPDVELSSLRLWKNIEPTLREALNSVYLQGVSGSKWKKQSQPSSDIDKKMRDLTITPGNLTRELPFYTKFLLLASYFASYNAPKSDFKHFVKNQGKQAKKRITRKAEKNRHLLGPKPFTLDRMLSIFFSIVGERVLPSALIFSQISSLVSMRLMSRVSMDEQLDCPKFKCLAELDLVSKIGKTINVDVMGYLDDFL